MLRRSRLASYYPALAALLMFAADAHAQGANDVQGFTNLARTIISVLQGIGVIASAAGFIFAGLKFNSGDPGAKDQAKNAIIGAALIAGAAVLAQFVKSFFP